MLKQTKKRMFIASVLMVVLVCIIGLLVWWFIDARKDPSKENAEQLVSKHMLLPSDEAPAQLTIVDKSKVNSAFLKNAETGDKVLVYQKNKKFVIYRPSVDKIVDVGIIQIDELEASTKSE